MKTSSTPTSFTTHSSHPLLSPSKLQLALPPSTLKSPKPPQWSSTPTTPFPTKTSDHRAMNCWRNRARSPGPIEVRVPFAHFFLPPSLPQTDGPDSSNCIWSNRYAIWKILARRFCCSLATVLSLPLSHRKGCFREHVPPTFWCMGCCRYWHCLWLSTMFSISA